MKLTLILFFISSCFNLVALHKDLPENMVFEGAGIKGIAYVGAISAMDEKHMLDSVVNYGGTSAGAIIAALLAAGFTTEELYDILIETEVGSFNDRQIPVLGGLYNLITGFGWYSGVTFHGWIEGLLFNRTGIRNITFEELYASTGKGLYLTATSLSNQKTVILSRETYPEMPVSTGVRISMSVPLYFTAVKWQQNGNQEHEYLVDGGIIANYPIWLFDSVNERIRNENEKTIGFRIDNARQIELDKMRSNSLAEQEISGLADFLKAFFIFSLENLNRSQLTDKDWNRTISIDSGNFGPKVRNLSFVEKKELFELGQNSVNVYLSGE